MGAEQHGNWRVTAAAALDWWVDAGVDTIVADAPRDWFSSPARQASANVAAAVEAEPNPSPPDTALPTTLEAFLAWRIGTDAPEAAWRTPRFAPTGPVDANLVIVTDHPDQDDRDGELLSGSAGRLLDAMLRAIGRSRDDVLVAPLCWARPLGDHLRPEQVTPLARLARHHLDLLPARHAILLGQAASRAIVGTDTPARWGRLRALNHRDRIVSALGVWHPRLLLERPHLKGEAWRDLQLVVGEIGV